MPRRSRTTGAIRMPFHRLSFWAAGIYVVVRSLFRFFVTGTALSGRDTDNATFLHAATKDYRDKPKERLSGPIWQRLARRWAVLGVPGILLALDGIGAVGRWVAAQAHADAPAFFALPWYPVLLVWLATVVAGTVGWQLWKLAVRWRARGLYADFVRPAARVVCSTLNVKYRDRDARRLVELPKSFTRELADGEVPDPVRVNLPLGSALSTRDQNNVQHHVGRVLGMPDSVAQWFLKGSHPYVLLTPRTLPPAEITWATVKARVASLPVEKPLVGIALGNHAVTLDFAEESPHVLLSGASGTGKSVTTKAVLCQRMHHGNGLIVIDYKRISHRWAHDLPGALYAWRIEDMHDMCLMIGEELDRRIANVVEVEARGEQFVTVDVLVEEANVLIGKLRDYWAAVKPREAPAQSPAVLALKNLVFAGRELGMHAIYCSQRGSADIFGASGGDVRESFSTVLLAKWKLQTWKMLAGGMKFQRWPGGGRGLWARIQNDEMILFRVPFIQDSEAREWAMSGEPCPDTPLGELAAVRRPVLDSNDSRELVTLAAALPELGDGITLSALRKASQRAGFPEPRGKVGPANQYALDELKLWAELRPGGREADPFELPGRRPAVVYAYDTYDEAGEVELGYVGQTIRALEVRDEEHRVGQPWADLIVPGSPRVLWEGTPTPAELDVIELRFIHDLQPRYNFEGQEGAPHATPKPVACEQRWARDNAAGRKRWSPVETWVS